MKIYVNRQPISGPWGGGAGFINSFYSMLDNVHEISVAPSFSDVPDIMICVGIDNDGTGYSLEQLIRYKRSVLTRKNPKIILRVNENDARKATTHIDKQLIFLSQFVDATVFVSNWLQSYFCDKGWQCKNNCVIINGVDTNVFKPGTKFNNEKINLLSSHWSDNALKGQDYTEWLDAFVGRHPNEYSFTFVGRTKAVLKNSVHIHPLSCHPLGDELGKYDVCINASRFDPGPNSVIEPISCGLPTYVHSDGGGGVEFAGSDHTFSSYDDLEKLLLTKKFEQNKTKFSKWEECVNNYVSFIERV